jgi:hypothetical protein
LVKFTTLNRHQLAGHVANLDFWLSEVRHCLAVIDGYGPRFERLRDAQLRHTHEHGTTEFSLWDPDHTAQAAAPPRRAPDAEMKEARRSLCDAVYRFLVRCFNEGFVAESVFQEACENFGIDIEASDLRSPVS